MHLNATCLRKLPATELLSGLLILRLLAPDDIFENHSQSRLVQANR